MNRDTIIKITKYLVDFMFGMGILVTLTLPWSIKWAGKYLEQLTENYGEIGTGHYMGTAENVQDRAGQELFCAGECGQSKAHELL